MTWAQFVADPMRRDIILVEAYPYDPATAAVVTLRLSSDEYVTLPSETPSNEVFLPVVLQGINRGAAADVPGTSGGLSEIEGGEILLGNLFGELDAWRDYAWDGRRIVVKHTGVSPIHGRLPYADAKVLFDGEARGFLGGLDQSAISLAWPEAQLDHPITTRVFRGTRYCLHFDGSTNYVSWAAPAKLKLTGALVWQGWRYFDSVGAVQDLIGWRNGAGIPWRIQTDATNHLQISDSGTFSLTSTLTVSAKRWYNITFRVYSATTAKLYVLDELAGTETVETFTGVNFLSRAAESGSTFYTGGTANFFDGLADDDRIWNADRSENDIRGARHRPLTETEQVDASLVFYAPYDDGTGSSVTDEAATPATGTVTGTATWLWAMEGDGGLAGTPKPDAWGLVENIPLIATGGGHPTWFVCGTKAQSIDARYEGAYSNYTLGASSPYTDLVTFLLATTAVNTYDVLTWDGGTYIRGRAPAAFKPTADVHGDASGAGYVETAGAIARRLLTRCGPSPIADPGGLDTTSFSDLDTDNSTPIGVYTDGTETIADVVAYALGSIGAVGFHKRTDGKYRVQRFEGVSGSSVLTLDERNLISLEPMETAPPVWLGAALYRKNWLVMEGAEIAGAATDERRLFVEREYRRAEARDESVRARHLRAEQVEWETNLSTEATSVAEATRRLALFSADRFGFRVVTTLEAIDVDRLQVVTLHYSDLDRLGLAQVRLGLGAGEDFVALGFADVTADGTVELEIWG